MNNITDSQLPMHKPEIYCYTIYGFLFSVAREKDMPWIYSNFIQIMYHDDWRMPIFEDHINLLQDCPFIQSYILNFKGDTEDFIETIINAINNNYYCYLFLDWYYINDTYYGDHFAHSAIVTGYDTANKTFTVYDNFNNGKFVKKKISFENTAKAFYSSKTASTGNKEDNDQSDAFSYLCDITFLKYNEHVYTKLDYSGDFKEESSSGIAESFPFSSNRKALARESSAYKVEIRQLIGVDFSCVIIKHLTFCIIQRFVCFLCIFVYFTITDALESACFFKP